MPPPGPFDRRIGLELKTVEQDSHGQPIETWAEEYRVWAHRRDVSGLERFRAQQEVATKTAFYTIRWMTGLNTHAWRVNDAGELFDIEAIAEPRNTRRQYLEMTCTAVGA